MQTLASVRRSECGQQLDMDFEVVMTKDEKGNKTAALL